ncbi:MAG: hypothetical protein QNJ09_11820 [Paracoccaceae bacterium]|nr:hypothetical protein [Paracoccaceae bacterium]
MKRSLQALALCLITCLPATAGAEITRQYSAGFWEGALETDNAGAPFNCFMRAQHLRDGYAIFLRWGKDGFHLSLVDARWALSPGTTFDARVRVDTRYDRQIQGAVLGPTLLDYPFAKDEAAWVAIASGSQITLDSPLGAKSFPLTGTSKAIDKLMECASEFFPDSWLEDQTAPAPAPPVTSEAPAPTADDPIAYALGIMLGEVDGRPEDAFQAVVAQAETGDRRALWLAGRMGLSGYGTDEEHSVSTARVLAAAEAGHPEALTFLALHYLASDDPIKEIVGKDYLQRAIAQAHGPAIAAQTLLEEDDWP